MQGGVQERFWGWRKPLYIFDMNQKKKDFGLKDVVLAVIYQNQSWVVNDYFLPHLNRNLFFCAFTKTISSDTCLQRIVLGRNTVGNCSKDASLPRSFAAYTGSADQVATNYNICISHKHVCMYELRRNAWSVRRTNPLSPFTDEVFDIRSFERYCSY